MLPFKIAIQIVEQFCHSNNIAMCAVFFNGEESYGHICESMPNEPVKDLENLIADKRLHDSIDEIINS